MLAAQKRSRAENLHRPAVPRLLNGDQLKSGEFLRRYEGMPELKKAELIEGTVFIMGSPVSADEHGKQDSLIQTWLGTYAVNTSGVDHYPNTTLILDSDNTFQPDAILCFTKASQGQSRLNPEGYTVGPVELIVEVAASSESIDLGQKFDVYARSGVKEYLVWRTRDKAFDWYVLDDEVYRGQSPDRQGALRSRTFVGLELDVAALLRLDGAQVIGKLQRALRTSAHAAFARRHR